jgi:hypothetical protein
MTFLYIAGFFLIIVVFKIIKNKIKEKNRRKKISPFIY